MTALSAQPPLLTNDQMTMMLGLARAAVWAQVTGEPQVDTASVPLPVASGAFVTLTWRGTLRGCLGTLDCGDDLAGEVARCAGDAASRDTRFVPVTTAELLDLAIEISVLGPLEPLDPPVPDALTVGRHGLVVERGRRRGLLLPQVAVEHGWTTEEFLSQTCRKAGLPTDSWRHGAQVFRFEADVFGDHQRSA